MKVSEIKINDVVKYLHLDGCEYSEEEIYNFIKTAKTFISNYTGIPITSTVVGEKTIDDYEDFYIVVMVLCQDMYDNRSMYVEKTSLNKVVDVILGMHCKNLL